nr:hypothetical protein [Thiocapsa sp. KS1]
MSVLKNATVGYSCPEEGVSPQYSAVQVSSLEGAYLTRSRIFALKAQGVEKVPGAKCGERISRIAVPSSAGDGPLDWLEPIATGNTGIYGIGRLLNRFVNENPEVTEIRNEGGVDFTRLGPGPDNTWVVSARKDPEGIKAFEERLQWTPKTGPWFKLAPK